CEGNYVMAVAGTHGKTTTSTMVAWLNHRAAGCGKAVLGGISKNFASNLVLGEGRRMTVEADEFDRSFLRLDPDVAVITSADADHLDIYGTHEAVKEAFSQFIDRIKQGGALIIKKGVDVAINNQAINVFRYSYDEPCDFYASNISTDEGGYYTFDLNCPDGVLGALRLGIPGWVNVENAVAAVAMLWAAAKAENRPLDLDQLRAALNEFSGVKRRFEFYVNTTKQVYMDDYAHHPRELGAAISSVRAMFPQRHLTAIFQPHLYTRTRDLYDGFAEALSMADEVVLLPIYPAREEPIEGVTTELIANELTAPYRIVELENLAAAIEDMSTDVVVSFGAGSIDRQTEALAAVAESKCR
ncbi:MAG: UDP-N-acetylmuramate--L-alanine ligase, partial [Rikenellaceae bacterium]|nr:UDP-N-acetylmuramate--L-alanine ligase [Rikenellaceae bacterium]